MDAEASSAADGGSVKPDDAEPNDKHPDVAEATAGAQPTAIRAEIAEPICDRPTDATESNDEDAEGAEASCAEPNKPAGDAQPSGAQANDDGAADARLSSAELDDTRGGGAQPSGGRVVRADAGGRGWCAASAATQTAGSEGGGAQRDPVAE